MFKKLRHTAVGPSLESGVGASAEIELVCLWARAVGAQVHYPASALMTARASPR